MQLTTNMSKYRQQLENKYNLLSLCSPDELLECKSLHYVSLLLTKFDKKLNKIREDILSGHLSDIMKTIPSSVSDTRLLTLVDVLYVKDRNKVILIEGGPGMGKSTLAIKICKSWANGELLEE